MAQVSWDLAAFRRAGLVGREGGLMELQVDGEVPAASASTALGEALRAANERLAEEEAAGRPWFTAADGPTPGPRGPLAMFTECEPVAALRLYLEVLAASLVEHGISGRLVPLPAPEPDRYYGNHAFGALTLFAQLPVDHDRVLTTYDPYPHQPATGWCVERETTRRTVEPLVEWVVAAGERLELMQEFTAQTVDREHALPLVLRSLENGLSVQLRASSGPSRMRLLRTHQFGQVLVQDYEPVLPRRDRLAALTGLMTTVARGSQPLQAWVQEAHTMAMSRLALLRTFPPGQPLAIRVSQADWWLFHLLGDHVFDAFVSQVLTDAQLARTNDLGSDRWTVTGVAPGRHLVQHRDPDAWLDDDPTPLSQRPRQPRVVPVRAPVADVLARARGDFGDAIMTLATLAERPFVEPGTGRLFGR